MLLGDDVVADCPELNEIDVLVRQHLLCRLGVAEGCRQRLVELMSDGGRQLAQERDPGHVTKRTAIFCGLDFRQLSLVDVKGDAA